MNILVFYILKYKFQQALQNKIRNLPKVGSNLEFVDFCKDLAEILTRINAGPVIKRKSEQFLLAPENIFGATKTKTNEILSDLSLLNSSKSNNHKNHHNTATKSKSNRNVLENPKGIEFKEN